MSEKGLGVPVRLNSELLTRTNELVCVTIPSNFRDILLSLASDSPYYLATWQGYELTHDDILLLNLGICGLQDSIIGNCEDMQERIDELERRIEDLENMNICVSCCNCNGNNSCDASNTQPPDGTAIFDPPNDADVQPIDPSYDTYKCEVSHWIVNALQQYVPALNDLVVSGETEYGNVKTVWEYYFLAMVPLAELAWMIYYMVVTWIINYLTGDISGQMVALIEQCKDNMVCALYGSINEQDALNKLSDEIMACTNYSWLVRYGLSLTSQSMPFETLFLEEIQRPVIPPEYVGASCPCTEGGDDLPIGCTDTGGDTYPAITDFCYRQIDSISLNAVINDVGQQWEILGRDFRIYGSNHPGNVFFGFNVDLGTRPTNALGIVFTIIKNLGAPSSNANGRIGTDASITDSLFVSGTSVGVAQASSTLVAFVNPAVDARTQAIDDALTLGDFDAGGNAINEEIVPGTNGYLGVAAAGGLLGTNYDVSYTKIAWIVYTGT